MRASGSAASSLQHCPSGPNLLATTARSPFRGHHSNRQRGHAQVAWHERSTQSSNSTHQQRRQRTTCQAQADSTLSLFPAGQRQARVRLPAVMLQLDASDVVDGADVLGRLEAAVAAGATAVVLQDSAAGAAALYEASLKVQGLLRGRAPLLLLDRTDIAAAVNADGVLLSAQGTHACQVPAKALLADPLLHTVACCNLPKHACQARQHSKRRVLISRAYMPLLQVCLSSAHPVCIPDEDTCMPLLQVCPSSWPGECCQVLPPWWARWCRAQMQQPRQQRRAPTLWYCRCAGPAGLIADANSSTVLLLTSSCSCCVWACRSGV